ncbi:winged helix-turn-helix domain-containing protein [Amylibacter sp. SFDW26]|uniref:winged helix-turn-helix domain-containing protein n=1 Tax=Amylibacter sp. SFDW26 TaxID=2652722 RepID=UPI0012622392|nr:crosslink repair DNA glycosylase YcaQ family protein [Amylibacter sp. SFDW26]KAB7615486.1 winged helix-turn-helix domain-containing protein [Amylibacter sp. SFDW26]
MADLRISNKKARQLWLSNQGLATAPTGSLDVMSIIRGLGFVQLDTIQVVSRAHHHIIWSRNQNYREPMLDKVLGKENGVFEHFTHDASVLPMEFYPMWQRQFRRKKEKIDNAGWYKSMLDADGRAAIKQRIMAEGPLSTHAFDTKIVGEKQPWSRPPHKLALDYMWYAGELATSHRENFKKFYDLGERVFPKYLREETHSDDMQQDWLCRQALDRLGFATSGEIQKFWEAMDAREVRAWIDQGHLVPVEVQSTNGTWGKAFAPADIEERLDNLTSSTTRLRILNPFDPVVRDRNRLERLFGFEYRIEIFVPEAKRKWGYYVFPILEGDRFVGRIEVKADRKNNVLNIMNVWAEPKVKWTVSRQQKLDAELDRMRRFVGLQDCIWKCSRRPNQAP